MSFNIWTPPAVSSEARPWQGQIWRMVEAQHTASTMKIVDNDEEQDLLETLLEGSKPIQPGSTYGLDYLLATPFRYHPMRILRGGSRFRGVNDPGVFYGAQSVHTASAELGFWRWKFLKDALDLEKLEPVAHTAFCADVSTTLVDLRQGPFSADALVWQHRTDYGATQAFARVARNAKVGAIQYQSVRDPALGWCVALLTPAAFAKPKPHPSTQTWWLAVRSDAVVWRRDNDSMTFSATTFASATDW